MASLYDIFSQGQKSGLIKQTDLKLLPIKIIPKEIVEHIGFIPPCPLAEHIDTNTFGRKKFEFLPKDKVRPLYAVKYESTSGNFILSVLECIYFNPTITQKGIKKKCATDFTIHHYDLWKTQQREHGFYEGGKQISKTAIQRATTFLAEHGIITIRKARHNRYEHFANYNKALEYAYNLLSWKYYHVPRAWIRAIEGEYKWLFNGGISEPELWDLIHTVNEDHKKCRTLYDEIIHNEICIDCLRKKHQISDTEVLVDRIQGICEGRVCKACGTVYTMQVELINSGDNRESSRSVGYNQDKKPILPYQNRILMRKCRRCSIPILAGKYCKACKQILDEAGMDLVVSHGEAIPTDGKNDEH